MRRSLALLALASAAACGEHSNAPADPGAGVTARNDTILVTFNPANTGPLIPSNFIGFSFQSSDLPDVRFGRTTAVLNVLRTLGRGVLRINAGGRGPEHFEARWTPGTRDTRSDSATVLIGSDFDRLFQWCAAANWTAIVGVNFAAGLADTTAAEVAFIQQRGGALVEAIEIGNEPDLYAAQRWRSSTYNFTAYAPELTAFTLAIQKRAPGVRIAGPATISDTAWVRQTIALNPSSFALATHHRYTLLNGPGVPTSNERYPTIEKMLSETVLNDELAFDRDIANVGRRAGVPVRLTELNSADGGGKVGVSDVFASALWAIDHTFAAAEAGLAGVNFHGGLFGAGYSAFGLGSGVGVTPATAPTVPLTAHPLLYGILAFQDAAQGQIANVTTTSKRRWNLSAHASTTASDGTVRIALVNKDTATLSVRVVVPSANTVTIRRLAAGTTVSPLTDSTGVTYAGARVTTTGTFAPVASETITPAAGSFVVSMPFASAAVVIVTTR